MQFKIEYNYKNFYIYTEILYLRKQKGNGVNNML